MERPSSKSSLSRQQGYDEQVNLNNPNVLEYAALPIRKSSRASMAPPVAPILNPQQAARGDSQSAAGCSKAAGGSKAAGDSQNAAGGSRAAGDFQRAAEGPKPRRSERITPAALQEVSGKLDNLKISKNPEGAQQVAKIERPQRNPGFACPRTTSGPSKAAAARRSAKPAREMNTKILVMSAMEELKSRKGVSLAAIDRNIRAKLGAQAKHWRPYVRTYLRKALLAGKLVHVPSRKRKDGKELKGLQGCFKPAIAARKSAAEKPSKKPAKTKKLAIKAKKTQVTRKKLSKIPEGRQRQKPTQRRR